MKAQALIRRPDVTDRDLTERFGAILGDRQDAYVMELQPAERAELAIISHLLWYSELPLDRLRDRIRTTYELSEKEFDLGLAAASTLCEIKSREPRLGWPPFGAVRC